MKLTYEQKLQMCLDHKNGLSYKSVARKYSINRRNFEYIWLLYEKHGTDILKHKFTHWTTFQKDLAVNRVLNGESIIYANEVLKVIKDSESKNGSLVSVYTYDDKFIGKGYINYLSKVLVRLLSRDKDMVDDYDFFLNLGFLIVFQILSFVIRYIRAKISKKG